jgi:proline dehydrogenase
MKGEGKPVQSLAQLEKLAHAFTQSGKAPDVVDFTNTEIAFADKSDQELKKTALLFRLMNNPLLVSIGAKLSMLAIKLRLPLFETLVRKTIFWQFCGGVTLLDSQPGIDRLYKNKVFSVLDYGVEGKDAEEDFNATMVENIRAIDFGSKHDGIPFISTKVTGLARFGLLENISTSKSLTPEERAEYKNVLKRIDSICHNAAKKGVSVFIDAEETWIQPAIDHLANQMMKRYNEERVVVYNTHQLYCTNRLAYLMTSFDQAQKDGYLLGAKLVRGAYLDKERERAAEMGYPSPMQPTKEATDHDYDLAIRFCIENYKKIGLCNASHNAKSNSLMAELIAQKGLPRYHPHLNFCQLYGMSDHLTFNLAKQGFNVAKYVVYGQVSDVLSYLVRRTQENTSITGDMSREYGLIMTEMKRRGL